MTLAQTITLNNLELTRFFIALVLLLFSAYICSLLFDKIKLPRVIGEIFGGLLLGPTVFGYLFPDSENWIFSAYPSEGQLLSLVSWFGLILLMFVSGVEIHGTFSREDKRTAVAFLLGATILPFLIGLAIATGVAGASTPSTPAITLTIALTVAFLVSGLLVLPRILRWLSKSKARFLMETSHSRFALFLCFLFVAAAALLNINIVFGAFLAGIAIGTVPHDTFAKATGSIKKISLALFTPAYFAIVGLQLDLIHQFDIVIFLGFLLLSSGLKIAGALGVGKLIRKSWLSSVNLAIGLNARGGP